MPPSFVIVPGACTPASMFSSFVSYSASQGVEAIPIQLPTVGRRLPPPHDHDDAVGVIVEGHAAPTVQDDVEAIAKVVEPLLDSGKEVILVASSLGGVVATQCLERLCTSQREKLGRESGEKRGKGIEKLVYVSALILEPDMSPLDFFGESKPPVVDMLDGNGYTHFDPLLLDPDGSITFSDASSSEQTQTLRSQMARFHSRKSFETKLTFPGYQAVSSGVYYVICEEDKVVPKEAQLSSMIETLRKFSSGTGKDVKTYNLPGAGHLPFITRPEETLKVLLEIGGEKEIN